MITVDCRLQMMPRLYPNFALMMYTLYLEYTYLCVLIHVYNVECVCTCGVIVHVSVWTLVLCPSLLITTYIVAVGPEWCMDAPVIPCEIRDMARAMALPRHSDRSAPAEHPSGDARWDWHDSVEV